MMRWQNKPYKFRGKYYYIQKEVPPNPLIRKNYVRKYKMEQARELYKPQQKTVFAFNIWSIESAKAIMDAAGKPDMLLFYRLP